MEDKYCVGCGAKLQTKNQNDAGYVKKIDDREVLYCKRCFRLKHYNEYPKITADPKIYDTMLDNIVKKDGLYLLIVDLFDFSGSFTKTIINKLRGKHVIVVANKYDLLPKSVKTEKIVDWISSMCQKEFFKVDAIHIVSSKKGYFIDDLMNTVKMLRFGKDVYFVGIANVGKSSLINSLLKRFTPKTEDLIVTSPVPGTTLETINIPYFTDNRSFIDTPGLINKENIIDKVLPNSYKKIMPNVEIKPKNFMLSNDQVIFIGGLCYLEILTGTYSNVTCYFSNNLLVHRTKQSRIPDMLKNHLGVMLTPPTKEEVTNVSYDSYTFKLDKPLKQDIVISGLGFFTVKENINVRINVIKGTKVDVRDAIIGN